MEDQIIEEIANRVCQKLGKAGIYAGLIVGSGGVITILMAKYLERIGYI